MQLDNPFSIKVSPILAKAVKNWIPRVPAEHVVLTGNATLSREGDLHFNSKNIRTLLMHADDSAGQMETFRLKRNAIDVLKLAHQKISGYGTRRLSLEEDIQDLHDTQIGLLAR